MALSLDSLTFNYPEYIASEYGDKVGGYLTDNELTEPNIDGEIQLFLLAVLYESAHVQYHKVFIKNNGDETAQNVSVYGYNKNSNNVLKMAVEAGQDQSDVLNGQEAIKNCVTEPHLFVSSYSFQDIPELSAVAVPDIPAGEGIGIWLRLSFDSIDAFASKDEFILGVNFEGAAHVPFNAEKTIGHSRISGATGIIQIKRATATLRGVSIEYEFLDTEPVGVLENEAIYAIYVDRIFRTEKTGTNRVIVQMYDVNVPSLFEVFLIPHNGYRPELAQVSAVYRNRVKLLWQGKNPEMFDVDRHLVFWDNATGTIEDTKMCEVDAATADGGGRKIESTRRIN